MHALCILSFLLPMADWNVLSIPQPNIIQLRPIPPQLLLPTPPISAPIPAAPLATPPQSPASQRGDDKCKYGAEDCNVCADDVEEQFFSAFDGAGMDWKSWKWHFKYNRRYQPSNSKARRVLDAGRREHVQGFVRTNNETIQYAMSHSAKSNSQGGFFFIKHDGKNSLYAMHRSNIAHPLSVAEIGQYVISSEDSDIRVFDLRRIKSPQDIRFQVEGLNTGGGLSMAKLADGSHLLVSSFKGSQNDPGITRNTDFHRLEGPISSPTDILHLGRVPYSQPSSWSGNYQYSDNLSLITECGTGHLYTIHTSGEGDDWRDVVDPDGYWRLSRVDWDENGNPVLTTLAGRTQDSDYSDCHHRSSATVHVSKDNQLDFFCHERSVSKTFWEDEEYYGFRYGQPK